jgi:hypothetical protein
MDGTETYHQRQLRKDRLRPRNLQRAPNHPLRRMDEIQQKEATRRCGATTKSGQPCRAPATNSGFCYIHSQLGRAAEIGRLGGRKNRHLSSEREGRIMKVPQNSEDGTRLLAETIARVKAGLIDPEIGRVLGSLASILLKAYEYGRAPKKPSQD